MNNQNRIYNSMEQSKIIDTLETYHATYELIYFIDEEYDINFIRSNSSNNKTDKAV